MSVAVANPIFTGVFTAVASVVIASGTANSGFVVSTIVTSCSAVEAFPFASVAVQVTLVVPIGKSAGASLVTSTLKISIAFAISMFRGVLTAVASAVIATGAVNSGFVVSSIITFCDPVVIFPFLSVAVQVIVVVPTGKSTGASFVTSAPNISLAVAIMRFTDVLTAVASSFKSAGKLSTGCVVSTTVTACIAVVELPFSSFIVHTTFVVPRGNAAGASLLMLTSNISFTTGFTKSTGVSTSVASSVKSLTDITAGGVVSFTVTL